MRRLIIGSVFVLSGCGGEGGTAAPVPDPPTLASIAVVLTPPSIASGAQSVAIASGLDQYGDPFVLAGIQWSISNSTVATITERGVITGARVGSATVQAISAGKLASATLTVSHGLPASLALRQNPSGGVNGRALVVQPIVEVRDAAGNVVTSDNTTTIRVSLNSGTLLGQLERVASNGVAAFSGLSIAGITGQTYVFSFSSDGLTPTTQGVTLLPFSFGNGTHFVGTGVPAGLYRSLSGVGASCYWARLANFSGQSSAIIANGLGGGPSVVQIAPSDVGFESSGCAPWTELIGPVTTSPTQPFGEGTFVLGIDIIGGTWQSNGSGSSCYWERLRDFSGRNDIIANYFGNSPAIVTISASDAGFRSSGCGTWTRIS